MRWINLEHIIQTEVSQKEKNKYCILTHIYMESRKMVPMNLFAGQQWRHKHREQTYGHGQGEQAGRRGWDKRRKLHGNICTTICSREPMGIFCMTQGN